MNKKPPTGILTVRAPVELTAECKVMAAKQGLTVSEWLTRCLTMGLESKQ